MRTRVFFCAFVFCFIATQVSGIEWSRCMRWKAIGNCKNRIPSWYFDMWTLRCKGFMYSGCGGNRNRFPTEEECNKSCLPKSKRKQVCSLEPKAGKCKAAIPLWYYDPESDKCRGLIYGGCKGNGNRFETCLKCMKRCSGHNNARKICTKQTKEFLKKYNLGSDQPRKSSKWPLGIKFPFIGK
uniref:BPTI/Kunitz inhibitor domain-containing protein n=1 Tax=Amblyomma maculatum TaxID=34609 RepID=G3MTV8_AMBMU